MCPLWGQGYFVDGVVSEVARPAAPREGGQKGSHVHCGYQTAHVMPTCASFSCWTSCDRQWPWALCGSEVSQELSYVPNILAYSVTGLDPCLHRACWGQWDQEEARPCSGHRGPWNKRCTHLGPYFSICACVVLRVAQSWSSSPGWPLPSPPKSDVPFSRDA